MIATCKYASRTRQYANRTLRTRRVGFVIHRNHSTSSVPLALNWLKAIRRCRRRIRSPLMPSASRTTTTYFLVILGIRSRAARRRWLRPSSGSLRSALSWPIEVRGRRMKVQSGLRSESAGFHRAKIGRLTQNSCATAATERTKLPFQFHWMRICAWSW